MTCNVKLSNVYRAVVLMTLLAFVYATNAGEDDAKNDTVKKLAAPKPVFDLDADDDGIIDAVKTLAVLKSTDGMDANKSNGELQKELTAGFARAKAAQLARRTPNANNCLNYMLLSPEKKARVDQRVQSRGLGVFGTRPCDPFVSPLLERPFDTDFIEVPLAPNGRVFLREAAP